MTASNDKELNTFGFVNKQLRIGLVTTIIGGLIVAVIVLFVKNERLSNRMLQMQGELYERMIREEVKPVMGEIKTQVEGAVNKVDTATQKLDSLKNKAQ